MEENLKDQKMLSMPEESKLLAGKHIEKYGAKISCLGDILDSENTEIEYVIDKLKPRG